jgi:hypothetical protein
VSMKVTGHITPYLATQSPLLLTKRRSIKDAVCCELANELAKASVVLTNPPPLKGKKVEQGITNTKPGISGSLV